MSGRHLMIVQLLILLVPGLVLASAERHGEHATAAVESERRILYWYDPMYPQQHFDAPGRSPFMDMDLVPRYADAGDDGSSIRIDPSLTRNLGMRLTQVERGRLEPVLQASAVLGYDQRQVSVLQTRAEAWVESVAALAPEDVLVAGAPLAELLVPDWVAAQEEYLALRRLGDAQLSEAAWQRLRLSGMPEDLMRAVRTTGRVQMRWTLRSPVAGVLTEWPVRAGMSLPAGSTVARINGIERIWLEAAVPEAQAASLRAGQPLEVHLPAWPGEVWQAKVEQLLPEADERARVVRVRAVLDNADARLRPGMSARVQLLDGVASEQLLVAASAVIRGGQEDLVMLAEGDGRFRPQRVRLGRESGERVEVLDGLEEGQQVVIAAQFLIDSEASLRGIVARGSAEAEVLHPADAVVLYFDEDGLMLEHGPFETLGMAGMSMQFAVDPALDLSDIAEGDAVRVWVREDPDGLPIVRIEKREVQP
ncbi:efflux RND transporter periplasmic adaptor subunit [Pseudomonas jilinensis]|uniref:Efflux RND transporter periplasmic adaptor subunit n=1 Tax=Pseudomonas jilinensis TaxID=2078689 RepID=A0A396RTV5_9PSED|nr:efflux RND transporter periplasmic adaptor subunit [Pseudomonas jilinensis]RHW19978.1 efflux RND transporter periplasmic adaptor subunit [Pseudomonas jilinensis]